MRSTSVTVVASTPGRTSAHSTLRANGRTGPARPARASASGCSMFADAKTPPPGDLRSRSLSSPDGPKSSRTDCPGWSAMNAEPIAVNALRRLPAA